MIIEPECVSIATNNPVSKNIYFACENQYTQLHHDPEDNFIVCVTGLKYIRLFKPDYSCHIPCRRDADHMSSISYDILEDEDIALDIPPHRAFYTINSLHKDYVDFLLRPGDVLFIPQFWWHFCKSFASPTITITHSFKLDPLHMQHGH